MVRSAAVVLLTLVASMHVAFAQLSVSDIKDEARRVDQRTLPGYEGALGARDIFAKLHDAVYHPAYKELLRIRDRYTTVRAAIDKATAAGDRGAADKSLDELKAISEELDTQVQTYVHSSGQNVQKIQIGLGVLAFAIGGIVVLIVRRRRR